MTNLESADAEDTPVPGADSIVLTGPSIGKNDNAGRRTAAGGLIGRLIRLSYERAGRRFPRFRLLGAVLPGLLIVAPIAVVALSLYFEMSTGEFLRILLAAWIIVWIPEVSLTGVIVLRRARPLTSWIAGRRGEAEALAAWRAGTTLPRDILRHPLPYICVAATTLGFDIYAAAQLGLPALTGVPVIFLGSVVVYFYWAVLRLFALEATLRPALEDISMDLPIRTHVDVPRMPLGRRLLVALPAMNLATGMVVAGVFAGGGGELGDFMSGVLAATVVTLTISVWLIAFISESVGSSMRDLSEAARRIGRGELGVRVPLASTDETGEVAQAFNEMAIGLQERERLRDAFGIFVDPRLTERVLEEGTDLAGEETEVSLLFMDIRGFTSYAEHAEARAVVAMLNDLYGEVVPIILRHEGHANKFIGDGLLAVFGAPNRLSGHADRAVGAGLEIARMVRERYRGELRVGIGVNSGRVLAGTIGGGGRLDFTVIGDTVNTAARVESATRKTGDDMLITEATRRALSCEVGGWEQRPQVALKGKAEKVRLYASSALG